MKEGRKEAALYTSSLDKLECSIPDIKIVITKQQLTDVKTLRCGFSCNETDLFRVSRGRDGVPWEMWSFKGGFKPQFSHFFLPDWLSYDKKYIYHRT